MVGVGLIALALAVAYGAHRLAGAWVTVGTWVPPRAADPQGAVAIPDDIKAWALEFGEEWAQDDALKAAAERYQTLNDWNLVRRAIGIGQVT